MSIQVRVNVRIRLYIIIIKHMEILKVTYSSNIGVDILN